MWRRQNICNMCGPANFNSNGLGLLRGKRGGGAPCFRIGGAEDNFIFYIEYCFFFVPVMKLRWEYNISKQFQSISCLNVWLRAHFPPSMIWGKLAFLTQKTWFHAISRLFSFPTIFICKKWAKYNFTATAKFRRNRFGYSNTPKHAQNWLFWGIFSFFLFLMSIFWELWTRNLLCCSSNVW